MINGQGPTRNENFAFIISNSKKKIKKFIKLSRKKLENTK